MDTTFGFAEETGFGVYTPPTRFLEIRSEQIKRAIERIESQTLRSGKRILQRWADNRKGASGSVNFELHNKGYGLVWKHILGGTPVITTPSGGTLSRKQVIPMGNLDGKSLTVQKGLRPAVAGAAQVPFSYVGGKIAEWEFSVDVDALALLSTTMDFQDEDLTQALAAPSYAAGLKPFTYMNCQVYIGGSPAPTAPTAVAVSGAGLGIGTYRYQVTFVNAYGETVGGAEATVTTTTGNQQVNLTAIPLGPTGTQSRKIYRTLVGGTTGTEKLVTTIPNNTATALSDTLADGSLGAAVPLVATFHAVDLSTFKLRGGNSLKTDRYFLRQAAGAGKKKEQLEQTAMRTPGGEFTAEFTDLALYNMFANSTTNTLHFDAFGDVIEGAINYQCSLDLANIRIDGETPTADGPDINTQSINYVVVDEGAGDTAIQATYVSTDTAA